MTHYRLTDSMPSAIILARNPRSSSLDELKTYQGNDIFLNNGDEFQIRLFNPLSTKIGAQVSINGKESNHLLVLNPGEDVVVDRFIDEQRRMIFETYQYDESNAAARAAVANNGIIDLKFFKEYFPPVYPSWNVVNTTTIFGDTSTLTSNSMCYDSNVFQCSSNLDFASENELNKSEINLGKISKSLKSRKETGRVSKGDKSSQNFQNVDVQFEVYPFHTITYHLKPMSERKSTREVREYCVQCHYRIRKPSYLYCPKCGNKL
jgi:hypothetical protein